MIRNNHRLFRLSASVALAALLFDQVLPIAPMAQAAPPPLAQPDQNQGDPPTRVGRIAGLQGDVSFHNPGDTQWSTLSVNYPVSTGNSFWTEPTATADLEVSDTRIVMNGGTEFDVSVLDVSGLQAVMPQGEAYLHLRDLQPNEQWSVQTPRGLVHLNGAGRYDIVVGTTDQPTLVTVLDGSAQIEGPNLSLVVSANQTATITGTDTFQGAIGPALRDAFLNARLEAERPRPAPAVPIPAQVNLMPGGADLVGTGSWSDAPDYGQVWYPPVATGWVPYRQGHWAFVAPWGWTWIDDAPWGFAPFHYGRWVEIGGRWAWTPGVIRAAGPPVYAPALVTFIGIGAGVALGAAIASGSIGWVPLGPREAYHPWYHASPAYVREVNITHVQTINNTVTINNYINRGAATSVPAGVMTGSRPVQGAARPVTAQEFAAARPIAGQQPLRPTATTAGVTPVVARQFNIPQSSAVARPATGPAIRVQAPGAPESGRPATVTPQLRGPGGAPVPAGRQETPVTAPRQAAAPPTERPAGLPERPAGIAVPAARPAAPAVRPTAPPPAIAHPAAPAATAHPAPQQAARPAPAALPPPARPAPPPQVARPAAPPAPRPEAQRPEAQRPEARPAPPARPAPGAERAAPRPEPARPAPQQHERRPGEP